MLRRPILLALLLLGLVSLGTPQTAHAQKPVLAVVHRFNGEQGSSPQSTLTLGTDGNFYGACPTGGTENNNGTLFKITPDGKFHTLFAFDGKKDGSRPLGAPVQGADGNFYGTTNGGGNPNGSPGYGTVYRITPQGHLTTLHVFNNADGAFPAATLLLAPDGSFYGSTVMGGSNPLGTIFRIAPDQTFSTLHSFSADDGAYPFGALVLGPDGALYGTANQYGKLGNTLGYGTVFRLTTGGTFNRLHTFNGTDGQYPVAGLTLGTDGALYGLARDGGIGFSSSNGNGGGGVVYKITLTGVLTTLHKFSMDGHGTEPSFALTLGTDGLFYGTTLHNSTGGNAQRGRGTVFSMTPGGAVTTLYKFHTAFDGANPYGGVLFGANGALYGTTTTGGPSDVGTIYTLTLP